MVVNFLNHCPWFPSLPGAFQFDISVLFSVNICVFSLSILLQVLLDLFPCCLSIRLFGYVFLVSIFNSKIIQLLLHRVADMFSCHLPQLVGRILFRCFGMSCFICIVLPFLTIFLIFFFRQYFLGFFIKLNCYFSLCSFFLFVPTFFSIFPLFFYFCQFS